MRGFYVTVRDYGRSGKLLGPYGTHTEALAMVETGRALAKEADSDAHWYSYGTAKVTAPTLAPGILNEKVTYPIRISVVSAPRSWEQRKGGPG